MEFWFSPGLLFMMGLGNSEWLDAVLEPGSWTYRPTRWYFSKYWHLLLLFRATDATRLPIVLYTTWSIYGMWTLSTNRRTKMNLSVGIFRILKISVLNFSCFYVDKPSRSINCILLRSKCVMHPQVWKWRQCDSWEIWRAIGWNYIRHYYLINSADKLQTRMSIIPISVEQFWNTAEGRYLLESAIHQGQCFTDAPRSNNGYQRQWIYCLHRAARQIWKKGFWTRWWW